MKPRVRRIHGDVDDPGGGAFREVWEIVRRVPRGRVVTYGQLSTLLGSRLSAAAVGWAMAGAPADVPWHRVVNARGGCSTERRPDLPPGLQRALLEAEGVRFGPDDRLDLASVRWVPGPRVKAGRGSSRTASKRLG